MGYRPPGDEIVVVGVEVIPAKPRLVGETVGEGLILKHAGPIGHRSTRKTRESSIHVCTSSAVEIPPLQVQRSEEVIDAL